MLFSSILLMFFVSLVQATDRCVDESEFCRYLKGFCKSKDHVVLMSVKCAATCGFCEPRREDKKPNISDVIMPPKTNLTMLRSRPNATEEVTFTTPKKCVFPKEKMLTTVLPENNTEYRFIANVSVVKKTDETVQTIVVQTINSTRVRQSPDTNEALKRLAQSKRNESILKDSQEKAKKTRDEKKALVMKKIKSGQLLTDKDIEMPRITTAEPSQFTVSLAKTLIRGTCFDEYIYCAEFSSLCSHPAFGEVMASHCTLTCKRCDDVDQTETEKESENCVDLSPECEKYTDVCHEDRYLRLTKKFCSKTCGHCKSTCRDRHQNCAQFVLDGFCTDDTYTAEEQSFLCGSTCKRC